MKEGLKKFNLQTWNKGIFIVFILGIISGGCNNEPQLIPKPRAYPKVVLPAKEYEPFSFGPCEAIAFEKPTYAEIIQNKNLRQFDDTHPCWFDLKLEALNGSIHCSYIPITHDSIFRELVLESFQVVDHVNKRSNYVDERVIDKGDSGGIFFAFEGPAASQAQFFITDSLNHFFKAALYFDSKARPDSIAPIAEFIQKDMEHMVETFSWK